LFALGKLLAFTVSRSDSIPGADGANATRFFETTGFETIEPDLGCCRKRCRTGRPSPLDERVQSPSEGFHGRLNPLAPSAKKSFLGLRQKILRPPTPLVAVLPQGLMVLREASDQGFQGVEFGLDDAQAREE
jgi:hypothetical protein